MRVIGKVIELRYNFDKEIESVIIESIPEHQYEITEDNNFELWKDYIANKTERVKMNSTGQKQLYEYVIYKGDEIICAGTRKECAEKLEVSEQTVGFLSSGVNKRRAANHNRPNSIRLIAEKVLISEIEKI